MSTNYKNTIVAPKGEFNSLEVGNINVYSTDITNWNDTYTDMGHNKANWSSTYTTVDTYSGDWEDVHSHVQIYSGGWQDTYTHMGHNMSNWNGTYTTVGTNSANWNVTYTTVTANSASWATGGSGGGVYSETIGDGTSTEITITHNLGTENIVYSVADATTKEFVFVQGEATTDDSLTLTFDQAPTQDEYNVTVIGGASSGTNTVQTVTTTTYTQVVDTTHHLYDDDTAGADITVTLASPASVTKSVIHKKIGTSHNVILTPPTGVTIDGANTYTITQQNESITLFTDGSNYYIQ